MAQRRAVDGLRFHHALQVPAVAYCAMARAGADARTFLCTDIEASAFHWARRPAGMRRALSLHDTVLRAAVADHGGAGFTTFADRSLAGFADAHAAVAAAVAAQQELGGADWPDGVTLQVRMGLDTGHADRDEHDGHYCGPVVNRVARVTDAANGGQILATAATCAALGRGLPGSTTMVDLGVHQLRGVVEPVRLYRVDHATFRSDPRPPRTGGVRAGNVPAAVGPLLGRAEDVDAVVADLADARIVTLTGVGGIGKTRVALEVARRLRGEYRDGLWFAALDTVDRRDGVLTLLLGMLAIDLRAAGALESLVTGLRFRRALLVLDSCEHVLEAAAEAVGAIIAACPHVQVLATSREPLDVPGERTRTIVPLDTDDAGAAVALFHLRADEAGAALDRARDAAAVSRICRSVEGIPLAIELAAARTRSLRPADIAGRLDAMLPLLSAGRRATSSRHRTMRATLHWSHDLLAERQQVALARLSVFAGSFSLEAAQAVARGRRLPPDDVVDDVHELVRRCMVVPVDGGDSSRFRLLEPVRQFAAEQLVSRGEAAHTREQHARWFAELLIDLGRRWRSGDDQATWPVAARELANLKAAFDHLVDAGRVDEAQRFVVAGYGPINLHFDNTPMYDWAPRAAALDPDHVADATASVCAIAAWGAMTKGDLDGAAAWLRRGEAAIAGGSRDDGLVLAAAVHHRLLGGESAVSRAFMEVSADEALRGGDLHRQVWVLVYTGRADEAVAAARRLGNRMLLAMAHSVHAQYADRVAPHLDDEAVWEAREAFWEAAQRAHSFLMLNNAAHQLGVSHILGGAAVEGLLLLRTPAEDWLLRGDTRVWAVLHAIATGLAVVGDAAGAARLLGAVDDRPVWAVTERERRRLRESLEAGLMTADRRRHERAGGDLDAGAAVAEALARIDALTRADTARARPAVADAVELTPRQHEVAELVARGLSNQQIARHLAISRFTAETHVRNILQRLGGTSRAEIAAWAVRRSLIDPPRAHGRT